MNSIASPALPAVLIVDDDESFRFLLGYAFRKSGIQAVLQSVSDGEDAIKYLSRQEPFADQGLFPFPSVVLLDLKMPRVSGWEVLKWKCGRAHLASTHFVVMSCSALAYDWEEASRFSIRAYHVKPMDLAGLTAMVKSLEVFLPRIPEYHPDLLSFEVNALHPALPV